MKYDIRGVSIQFPFPAYDCQLVYMEKVIQSLQEGKNALLESPTGTGKTLCLLCSSLAWRKQHLKQEIKRMTAEYERGALEFSEKDMALAPRGSPSQIIRAKVKTEAPKIIYASRTHSQLSQVMDELKNCPYSVKASVLGSRKQLCVNSNVTKKPSNAQGNACRTLVSKRKCIFHHKVKEMKGHSDFVDEPLAIEELAELGKKHRVCPYYISKDLQNEAEILFVPYNYLIDPVSRKSLNIDLEGSILIFDEAHNLEGVCTEAASFQFHSTQIEKATTIVDNCLKLSNSSPGLLENYEMIKDHVVRLKIFFSTLYVKIMEMKIKPGANKGIIMEGTFIFELMESCGATTENFTEIKQTCDSIVNLMNEEVGSYSFSLVQFSTALSLIYNESDPQLVAKYYKIYIEEKWKDKKMYNRNQEPERTLNFWCFNSGAAMKSLNESKLRSLILTSGTLSPLDSFAFELQTDFPIQLENPHVIDNSQIWIGVTSCGPSGHRLNTSYEFRSKQSFIQELGNTIVNFSRIVPNGLLVFFSSYTLMDQYIEMWKKPLGNNKPIWERIMVYKKPVVEPREGALLNDTITDFYKKVNSETGAVFFAVCRGKVSEGLDFANDNGRAVIVTGIPFPSTMDQRVKLKQQYLDKHSRQVAREGGPKTLTGSEWFKQQASRAVNQAVGRVIRHRGDYGAILLCDERFGYPQNQNQLSCWLRPHTKVYKKFGEVSLGLTRFFKYAKATFPYVKKTSVVSTSGPSYQLLPGKKKNPLIAGRKKFVAPRKIEKSEGASTLGLGKKRGRGEMDESTLKKTFEILNAGGGTADNKSTTDSESRARKRKKTESALSFIQQSKSTLSPQEYKEFQGYLREYKSKSLSVESLVRKVKALFDTDEKKLLINGFSSFIPEKHKKLFHDILAESPPINGTQKPTPRSTGNLLIIDSPTKPIEIDDSPKKPNLNESIVIISLEDSPVKNKPKPAPQSAIEIDSPDPPPVRNKILQKFPDVIKTRSEPQLKNEETSRNPMENPFSQPISQAVKKKKVKGYDLVTGQPIYHKPKRSVVPQRGVPREMVSKEEKEELETLTSDNSTGGIKCSICQENATAPFSSRCGHICCKECWDKWLAVKLICPVCRDKVRQKRLTKLFFT